MHWDSLDFSTDFYTDTTQYISIALILITDTTQLYLNSAYINNANANAALSHILYNSKLKKYI